MTDQEIVARLTMALEVIMVMGDGEGRNCVLIAEQALREVEAKPKAKPTYPFPRD